MEKFQSFTDASVGINPFVQRPARRSLAAPLVSAVRFLVASPVALSLLLFDTLASIFSFVPVAEWILRTIFVRTLATATLWMLGISRTGPTTLSPGACRVPRARSNPSPTLRAGDVLLVNSCSYLDVLVLASMFNPAFVVGPRSVTTSLLTALRCASDPGSSHALGRATPQDILAWVGTRVKNACCGPLVIAPECAPTNGQAMLTWAGPLCSSLSSTLCSALPPSARPVVHVAGLRYASPQGGESVTRTAGSAWGHLWRVAGVISGQSVSVWRLPPGHEPQPGDFPSSSDTPGSDSGSGSGNGSGWVEAAREALLATLRPGTRMVALDYTQHAAFLAAVAQVEGKGAGQRKEE